MGSGKLLKRAIEKYGIGFFRKEILYVFDNEEEMNLKERELVVVSKETYNLTEGGAGGFGYINKTRDHITHNRKIANKRNYKDKNWLMGQRHFMLGKSNLSKKGKLVYDWTGKTHKEETKNKISMANKGKCVGEYNSQYGTIWITNGQHNLKIKKEELTKMEFVGYRKGRTINGRRSTPMVEGVED